MPIFKNDTGLLIYLIHIPKTAGTSLDKLIGSNYHLALRNSHTKYIDVIPQHLDRSRLEYLGLEKLIDISIAVTRNPLDRLYSEFKYRTSSRSRFTRHFLDFDSFVYYVYRGYKKDSTLFSNHIKPQVDFILDDTIIYKLEDGLELLLSDLKNKFSVANFGEIGFYNRSEQKKIYISNQTYKLVSEMYQKDYEAFGYKLDEPDFKRSNLLYWFNVIPRVYLYKLILNIRSKF
jgi:hypothetical protein